MWFDHLIWFMLFYANSFFPLSSNQASLAACINWLSNLPPEVKQAVLVYYIIHPNMLTKAKISLDPSLATPPIIDNTPLSTLISSLFRFDEAPYEVDVLGRITVFTHHRQFVAFPIWPGTLGWKWVSKTGGTSV